MKCDLFADIIIEISHEQLDRPFQYRIPEKLRGVLKVGDSVSAPFGASNRVIKGYVIAISNENNYPIDKIKELYDINHDQMSIEGDLIALAGWMKRFCGGTMIQALKTVLPVKRKMKLPVSKRVDLLISPEELAIRINECETKHQTARLRVLLELSKEHTLPYELVCKKLNVSAQTLKSLENNGIIRITQTEYYRNPVVRDDLDTTRNTLSHSQKLIIDQVTEDYKKGTPGKYLIHGITGSGKTEVYLGITEQMVQMGKQVIVLIPEISLTYQTLLRFYKRFGDRVSVVNSSLSAGERYDQYVRAMRGELDVIIGPRSALFTPFARLGAIIIDEEHENSYKSENTPRYHARDCAEYISDTRGVSLVLGSATPSVESFYKAQTGVYRLFSLNERLTGQALPQVYSVDMREELRNGNRMVFSQMLQEMMKQKLESGEQIILFLNRRGYAGFVSCRSCGHVMKCIHCDISLTEHRGGKLICHYCGYSEPKPSKCPKCGSEYIAGFKVGTEQIETQVKKMFPKARVLRMDADTTRGKGDMENILRRFQDREGDVLVGTQMIVKGHDFPGVTLVGILAADLSLGVNDYRAAERTFELLTQAAGRAGRGSKPGQVVVQTYQPEHYSIVCAVNQDYQSFYEEEILYRKLGDYPPTGHLLAVLISSDDYGCGKRLADRLKQAADSEITDRRQGYTIGPAPASIGKLMDRFRFVLYIKSADMELLVKIKDCLEKLIKEQPDRHSLTFFDFDPNSGL